MLNRQEQLSFDTIPRKSLLNVEQELSLLNSWIGAFESHRYTLRLYIGSYYANIPNINKNEYGPSQEFTIPVIKQNTHDLVLLVRNPEGYGFYCILSLHNISQPQKHFLLPPKGWGNFFIYNFLDRHFFAENPVFLDYAKQMLRWFETIKHVSRMLLINYVKLT